MPLLHSCQIVLCGVLAFTGITNASAPSFEFDSTYFQEREDIPIGTHLFSFTVSDATPTHTVHITATPTDLISITPTSGSGSFTVNVTLKANLDREISSQHDLVFVAVDNVGNRVPRTLVLYVQDVNDNPPSFRNIPYFWNIPELPYSPRNYSEIVADDPDSGISATVRYSLSPNTQSSVSNVDYMNTFEIDSINGVVTLKKPLHYDRNSYYQFTVEAKDLGNPSLSSNVSLIIRVQDVQNKPPFFNGVPYRVTIKEEIESGKEVKTVNARDGDTGISNQVNYTIHGGTCNDLFTIDAVSGNITTSKRIDRDNGSIMVANGICDLTILVQEEEMNVTQYGNTSATTDVSITIEDINDNVPTFANGTYHATVQENAQQNVPIEMLQPKQIFVSDLDQGENARMNITLQWTNRSRCDAFKVSPDDVRQSGTLIIQVTQSTVLDFEVTQHLEFLILATEAANASHVATSTVVLNITDENDNSPQFDERKYEFNVSENSSNRTVVGTISATDADSGSFGELTYSLLGSEDKFTINITSGVITTVCDPGELDRETISIYYLTVTVTDDGGQGRSNSTSIKINLIDMNDNSPEFLRDKYQVFVRENDETYKLTPVLIVSAQDRDEIDTDNSRIEYDLDLPLWISSNITINETTGEIFFEQAIDFEGLENKETGIINFTVMAKDFGNPKKTGNTSVEISIEDLNDNSPIFNTSSYSVAVQENATSSVEKLFHVLNVSAVDMDGSQRNNRFQYFIQNGALNRFGIDPQTGTLYVQRNAVLDRETVPVYNITLLAIDLGSDPGPLNGTTVVTINITDVNDEPPKFDNSSCITAEILESESNGAPVTDCSATDPDSGHDLYYNITAIQATDENGIAVNTSLVKDFFKIDHTSGSLTVQASLDREIAQIIVLTITVEDQQAELNLPQIDSKLLTITLLDVNDNDPVFNPLTYTMNVSENAHNPTRLDTVQASDADKNRTIIYSIVPGEDPISSFRIDNASGIIFKDGHIDRERNSTVILTVTATDNGIPTRNQSTSVFINVIDFNDNSPSFYQNSTDRTIHILENVTANTLVFTIMAYDIDDGNNGEVTYSFESGVDDTFAIGPVNGSVTTLKELDREIKGTYTIRIVATDNSTTESERRSNLTTLTVDLDDVNDNAPVFDKSIYHASTDEIATIGTVVTTIIATDADADENKEVTYEFTNETDPPWLFAIDSLTGEITVNTSLRSHAGTYVIQLMAADNGSLSLNNVTVVNITVQDNNLNRPIIIDLPENDSISVYECSKNKTVIYIFNYTDKDSGVNADAYFNITALEDDNSLEKFEIDKHGTLRIKSKLDANIRAIYKFQIQVTDKGEPPLSSEKLTITIRVIDVNNFLPGFTNSTIQLNVRENQSNGTPVGTVTAVDDDKDSVTCYNISQSLNSSLFNINERTGSITTKRLIDREVDGNKLQVMVMAWDCTVTEYVCEDGTLPPEQRHRPNITVTIVVTDENDNPPMFLYDEISVGMRRNEEVGFVLDLDLKNDEYVKDNDTDKYGRQSWIFENNGSAIVSTGLNDKVSPGSGTSACGKGTKNLFCITGNGTIVNNMFFSEDMSGYFLLPVSVRDAAGSSKSVLKIYLISDSQVLIMTLFDTKQTVAPYKDVLLEMYSNITQYTFVYDGLQDHKTPSGTVDTRKSDLYFHVVDPKTQRILPADEAQRLIDSFYDLLMGVTINYKVLSVLASTASLVEEEADPMRTVYILTAVVVLMAITIAVIVYAALTVRKRYQRKIKALSVVSDKAVISKEESNNFIPGSNHYSKTSNPLLNAKVEEMLHYDTLSIHSTDSIDKNEVGNARDDDIYDGLETIEKRMDLYMEDEYTKDTESPLDAALKMHELNKASVDDDLFDYGEDEDDDYAESVDQEKINIFGCVNQTFEMETSDI